MSEKWIPSGWGSSKSGILKDNLPIENLSLAGILTGNGDQIHFRLADCCVFSHCNKFSAAWIDGAEECSIDPQQSMLSGQTMWLSAPLRLPEYGSPFYFYKSEYVLIGNAISPFKKFKDNFSCNILSAWNCANSSIYFICFRSSNKRRSGCLNNSVWIKKDQKWCFLLFFPFKKYVNAEWILPKRFYI